MDQALNKNKLTVRWGKNGTGGELKWGHWTGSNDFVYIPWVREDLCPRGPHLEDSPAENWCTPGTPGTSFSFKYLFAIEQREAFWKKHASKWTEKEVCSVNKEIPSSSNRFRTAEIGKLKLKRGKATKMTYLVLFQTSVDRTNADPVLLQQWTIKTLIFGRNNFATVFSSWQLISWDFSSNTLGTTGMSFFYIYRSDLWWRFPHVPK